MNREPRRIPPKLLARTPKQKFTREVTGLPKPGMKDILRQSRRKITTVSPSQPHSKSFGR